MLISISMFKDIWPNILNDRALIVVDNVIFANFLIGTTIQDGGKRKRNNIKTFCCLSE